MNRISLRALTIALGALLLASCNGSSSGNGFVGNLPGPNTPSGFTRAFIADCTTLKTVHIFAPPFSATSTESGNFGPSRCGNGLSFNSANGMLARSTTSSELILYSPPYSSATTPTVIITGGATTISAAEESAWDGSGNVWLADPGTASVKRFSPPFTATGAPTATNTNVGVQPSGLAINPSAGLMFVGDVGGSFSCATTSCHVYVVPAPYTGVATATFTFGTSTPFAIAVDQLGRLFVGFLGGPFGGQVKVYLPPYATGNTAAYTLTVGGNIVDMAFDAGQNLYVQTSDSHVSVFNGPILGSMVAPSFVMSCPSACGDWGGVAIGP